MDTIKAANIALDLMKAHGLEHLSFRYNRRRTTFGIAKFLCKRPVMIELSEPLVKVNDEATVRDVILHEIAHALAGIDAKHGWQWQIKARSIGCNAERTCGAETVMVPGRYKATCPCNLSHSMHRAPKRRLVCRGCKAHLEFVKS